MIANAPGAVRVVCLVCYLQRTGLPEMEIGEKSSRDWSQRRNTVLSPGIMRKRERERADRKHRSGRNGKDQNNTCFSIVDRTMSRS